MSDTPQFTHINASGEAHMVDVGAKEETKRSATAQSIVQFSKASFNTLMNDTNPKGDVFATCRIAGIQAAKKCADLIPLCHPLMLTKITVDLSAQASDHTVKITATCQLSGKTGVEMEALVAASIAALTLYDMCKAIDKGIVVKSTQLVNKSGGKSDDWNIQAP